MSNPYRMAETDLGDRTEGAVTVGVIDRGLLPDSTIAARHPVPEPSAVGSPGDGRRVRAALVTVLRQVAEQGDSLLSTPETLERLASIDLARPCVVGTDWVEANQDVLEGVVEAVNVLVRPEEDRNMAALQLTELKMREETLRKILGRRAVQPLPSLGVDWSSLLVTAIRDAGGIVNPDEPRHAGALKEQSEALECITTRKLAVLVGRAGTGKTSVLGALLRCEPLVRDGVLLLAPTGKARVRLARAAGAEAMTIAQFLYRQDRYDGIRQRVLFSSPKTYREKKTVVIDECSMLTMDDLAAVLGALDLIHVQRLILVGDPNQLPPIGAGRPFADFVGHLEQAFQADEPEQRRLAGALGRLTVELRTSAGAPSDTLRLASWFTREPQPVDADRVLSDLNLGFKFNDLELCFWTTPDEMRARLAEQFQRHLGLTDPKDIAGFNRALGLDERGWVPYDAPAGAENFQILSPVRMHPHGVQDLNRWIQKQFRDDELKKARKGWATSLGDDEIVVHDKVIQVWNERRKAYDGTAQTEVYLANGEIGTVGNGTHPWLNVVFAGRPGLRVGYRGRNFPGGSGPLELAYALTVHKAQGSDFRTVFVVLPKNTRLISRELLYTALTRSRDRLVLLIEGTDAASLFEFSKPEKSETARRNTNLFQGAVRESPDGVPYAEHLIHRTEKGHMVRSKSELVIANMLFQMQLPYYYERLLEGTVVSGQVRPDFSFADPAGELIVWEHLGMMSRDDYRRGWQWKREWYEKNGFVLGENLFTSEDDERGGLDSTAIRKLANTIKALV